MLRLQIIFILLVFALVSCATEKTDSPTATVKKYFEFSQKNDLSNLKTTLSRASLQQFENAARAANKSNDEVLKSAIISAPNAPETRAEKIEGDAARVEIKNPKTGTWDAVPLVRENGEWRIALDKFKEEISGKK
jgi:hypothetical protein